MAVWQCGSGSGRGSGRGSGSGEILQLLFVTGFGVCCAAVDEENNRTLTFELENTRHVADDDDVDNDDVNVHTCQVGHLLPATISISPISPSSPAHHLVSSSSGYSSTTHGGLLSPEELPTQSTDLPTSDADRDSSSELGGITTEPCGNSGTSSHIDDISTDTGGIPTESGSISTKPSGTSGTLSDHVGISTEPCGISGTSSHHGGISTDTGGIPMEPGAISGISSHQDGNSADPGGISTMDEGLPDAAVLALSSGTLDIPHSSLEPSSSSSSPLLVPPNIPVITTDLLSEEDLPPSSSICVGGLLPLTTSRPMMSLEVPHLALSISSASSDGDSSFCSTPGTSTPEVLSPGILAPEGYQLPFFASPSTSIFLYVSMSLSVLVNF